MDHPLPSWLVLIAVFLVAAAAPVHGSTHAQDTDPKEMTVVATEEGCSNGKTFCFKIQTRPSNLTAGDEVNLTLQNQGATSHNVHVTLNESADPDHQDTDPEDDVANTSTIQPGENASTTFTVPNVDALYLWCDRTGHEASDMWATLPIPYNYTPEDDTDTDDPQSENATNETDEDGTQESQDDPEDEPGQAPDGDTNEQPPLPGQHETTLGPAATIAIALSLLLARLTAPRR